MKKYRNLSGSSGIAEYEIGIDFIRLNFSNSPVVYTYSYSKAGKEHVEIMKALAEQGRGLNTYLNQHVKDLFD